ncbi:hypothetical protein GYMLUDRAFT_64586 [Collybiopsis luxurians FD-317 M1]|uniref:Uncharacterized protein n=1 Tax=Collybiopsis luxurians FD-317 M1 TaxID=944289 RepID=A0A0D0CAG1_9AGAR|nr:hypothetical protein GYMLUDRAFT_64586 [Collybiopsis luxurians FD-317 M1]
MPSPTASLISITEEEFEEIRVTKTLFECIKEYLPAYILTAMHHLNSLDASRCDKWPRDKTQSPDQPPSKNPKFMPPIIKKSYNHLASQDISILECLYAVAKHNNYLPLPIFTEKNLIYIHAHAALFKMCKVSLDGMKQEVIVLKDLLDKLGILKTAGRPDEGLMYPQFQQAAKNYYLFETERDPDSENGTHSAWMCNHFLYFMRQPETELYYDL